MSRARFFVNDLEAAPFLIFQIMDIFGCECSI